MPGTEHTQENNEIFHNILAVFAAQREQVSVPRYYNDDEGYWIDIVSARDCPAGGVASYATIGLSGFSIGKLMGGTSLGIEIVGACERQDETFLNILSTCAFHIMAGGAKCFPGCVFQDVVGMYLPNRAMRHVIFVPPFGWENEFAALDLPGKKVAWLQAIPISEAEYQFANEKGADELTALFAQRQIDYLNLERASVV